MADARETARSQSERLASYRNRISKVHRGYRGRLPEQLEAAEMAIQAGSPEADELLVELSSAIAAADYEAKLACGR
ncbi:hypothetical protein KKB83_03235 [Patescibacteria group bacterium]|nr:hypothetical protein [Patescibacteria group bacterium]